VTVFISSDLGQQVPQHDVSGEVFTKRGRKATKTLVIWLSVEQYLSKGQLCYLTKQFIKNKFFVHFVFAPRWAPIIGDSIILR
jgi:hypothetical protein